MRIGTFESTNVPGKLEMYTIPFWDVDEAHNLSLGLFQQKFPVDLLQVRHIVHQLLHALALFT